MEQVRKDIINFIDDNDLLTDKKFALLLGCSPQLISGFRNEDKNISFRNMLKAAYIMRGDNYSTLMDEWCLELNTTEGIKQAFEFACITRNINLLEKLLEIYEEYDGVIGECVSLYTLLYEYNMIYKVNVYELTSLANSLKITDKSLLILVEIIKACGMYYNKRYFMMLETASGLENRISSLSDKRELFIKECYRLRLSEIFTPALFHLNDMPNTRIHAERLINSEICAKMVSDGYYYMGMTYLVEDESKCLEHLQLSYEILNSEHQILSRQALSNLNFARSYYSKTLTHQDNETDEYIIMFNKIKTGNALDSVEIEKLSDKNLSTFKRYYKALNDKCLKSLCEVFTEFISVKNVFFANVIYYEILKVNTDFKLMGGLLKLNLQNEGVSEIEKNVNLCFRDFSSVKLACC